MDSKKVSYFLIILAAMGIINCASFEAHKYSFVANHIGLLKMYSKKGKKINIIPFTATETGITKIQCRGAGPVVVPGKMTYEEYIYKALLDELNIAELTDENSTKTVTANLDSITFDSVAGNWKIVLTFFSNSKKLFTITTVYKFESYFDGREACIATANAFDPAVQQLMHDIIVNPEFAQLFN